MTICRREHRYIAINNERRRQAPTRSGIVVMRHEKMVLSRSCASCFGDNCSSSACFNWYSFS